MRVVGAVAAAVILAAFLVHPARGAECWATVTPEAAAPGDDVTLEIHKLGCDYWGDELYLIPEPSYESLLAQGQLCSAMAGAILIGPIDWTHAGADHEGVLHFAVPDISDGVYMLGEDLPDVLPHCDRNGALSVTSAGHPDTAMEPTPAGRIATAAGLIFFLIAVALASMQASGGRPHPASPTAPDNRQ